MTRPASSPIDQQLAASARIADVVVAALTNDRGVHAETAVAAAARMAGTFLFRSFRLPVSAIPPGAPVLSDVANERGPVLVEVLQAGLKGLGLPIGGPSPGAAESPDHRPQLTFLETQRILEPKVVEITRAHGLEGEGAARSCALATAILIHRAKSVLDPTIGFGLAVYGFVEGTKTMPEPLSGSGAPSKPWYKLW